MPWGRFLINDELPREVDLGTRRQAIDKLRSNFLSGYNRELLQEEQLWQLWLENAHLKITLNRLTNLLVHRNVISDADRAYLVAELERMEGGGPG